MTYTEPPQQNTSPIIADYTIDQGNAVTLITRALDARVAQHVDVEAGQLRYRNDLQVEVSNHGDGHKEIRVSGGNELKTARAIAALLSRTAQTAEMIAQGRTIPYADMALVQEITAALKQRALAAGDGFEAAQFDSVVQSAQRMRGV